jgi:hypothetical protein
MMSEAMDPSLELQQLAVQAVNYHQQQVLRTQQGEQQGQGELHTEYVTHNEHDNAETQFICPFPACNRLYKRKDLLKRHLTTLLASPDENHQDHTIWEHVRSTGVMTVYSRPRNLTEDQKKQRRKESNLRHRVKYATELKEKRNRKRRVEKLLEGKQVGVQTPDWEAEAREQANLAATVAVTAAAAAPQAEVLAVQAEENVSPRRRRVVKSKQ